MISSALILVGFAEAIVIPVAVIGAIISVIAGIFSLWRNRVGGLFSEDPLHMMQLLFYFGLIVFSISEVSIAASVLFADDIIIGYLPSMTRVFGMIFWLLGVLNYVRATNKVLEFINVKVWILLILFCIISVASVVVGFLYGYGNSSIFTMVNVTIFTLGIGIMTFFVLYLAWIFRLGEFRNLLFSIFFCLFFALLRSIVIAFSTDAMFVVVSLTLALETYLCLWISESLFFNLLKD